MRNSKRALAHKNEYEALKVDGARVTIPAGLEGKEREAAIQQVREEYVNLPETQARLQRNAEERQNGLARLARNRENQAQRERNGGLTDREVEEATRSAHRRDQLLKANPNVTPELRRKLMAPLAVV